MTDLTELSGYEFLKPMVSGWLAKVEAGLTGDSRKRWKEVADECHDEQTEVLTSTGWTLFSELTGEEPLATVNLETDSIEYQKPTRLVRHRRSGEMVRFAGKSLDAIVTPGHRMVFFRPHSELAGFREARSLNRSDQLKLTAKNWSGTQPVLPEFLGDIEPEDFAEWLGFYIAEGWCDKERPVTAKAYHRVMVAQKKTAGRAYYERLAERVGLPAPRHGKRLNAYQFTNKKLCSYLRQFGDKCYTKRVPQWVKDAPQGVIRSFLRGYVAGDGHRSKLGQVTSITASRQLADDVQELWLKIGRSAVIKEREPAQYNIEGRTGWSGKLYLVTAWCDGKRASLKRHTNGKIKLKYSTEHYDGIVYCATVPNGTLITRRNGKPLISGNCVMFYSKSAAAMWDTTYTKKFWRNVKAPKFRITINKAFELVAVFGPNLLWDIPHRTANPKKVIAVPPEIFGQDEQGQMIYQSLMQEMTQDAGVDKLRAHLMQAWLNYTPREMPGGGMEVHNELAVVDSLVKGRGVMWPSVYNMPSSDRNLTGCFHDRPDDLIVDPDFKTLQKATWVARRHVDPHWRVERRFQLPAGSLKGRATLESSWHYSELKGTEDSSSQRRSGKTNDLVVWYEIWSKMGCGARLTGMPDFLKSHLEETVGDYAYICVCPDCPYPLNCPTDLLKNGASDKEVSSRFEWPIPLWTDDRWPFEVLDFYHDTEGSWPIPPLAPAMGELKFLNFLIPWACNRIYSSSRDFWAVMGAHYDEYKKYLEDGEDQVVFPIPPGTSDDIRKAIQVLQQPETRLDVWKIIELVSDLFDKRTGLTEFAYGRNEQGTQDRTAETTMARQRAVGVRPEHMQKKVKGWQSRLASVEAMLTWMFIKGKDTVPLLSPGGAQLWTKYIENGDHEQVVRQMNFDISAASIRRPDRDRDIDNLQEVMARWLPVLQAYGETSGNFDPVNGVMKKWGELHDMDLSECMIQSQEPDPELPMLQKEQMKAETQKTQAEAVKAQAEAQANPAELKMVELAMEQKGEEQRLAMEIKKMQVELQAKMAELQMKMAAQKAELEMKAQEHQQDMAFKQQEGQVDLAVKQEQGAMQIAQGRQQMEMQRRQGEQQLKIGEQQGKQQLQQTKQQSDAKVQAMKAQARAKPKPTGSKK